MCVCVCGSKYAQRGEQIQDLSLSSAHNEMSLRFVNQDSFLRTTRPRPSMYGKLSITLNGTYTFGQIGGHVHGVNDGKCMELCLTWMV